MIVKEDTPQAKLWTILDNIDTLSDMLKPNTKPGYKAFYNAVMQQVERRHEHLESDGRSLYEPGTMPKGGKPTLKVVPDK